MSTTELDIWRSAQLLINQHGDQAELVAAGRVDDMIERGDPKGESTWKRIRDAIRELRAPSGARPH